MQCSASPPCRGAQKGESVALRGNGDRGNGFLAAFLGYRSILAALAARFVRPGDVEDIVQETFLRVFMADSRRNIDHPKTFMHRTARNLALNFIARKANVLVGPVEEMPDQDVYTNSSDPESQYEAKEKFRLFCLAVRHLPPACRRAFILKRVYGLSQGEIAAYMNISESTVEKHVAKGLVRCTEFLRSHGYSVGDGPDFSNARRRAKRR